MLRHRDRLGAARGPRAPGNWADSATKTASAFISGPAPLPLLGCEGAGEGFEQGHWPRAA